MINDIETQIIINIQPVLMKYNVEWKKRSYNAYIEISELLEMYSLLSDTITRYAPENSTYYIHAVDIIKTRKFDDKRQLFEDIRSLYGILSALNIAYTNHTLTSISALVRSEIFSDFLDMAEYFLSQGDLYKHPAAFLIGGVLEEQLRKLAIKFDIPTIKENNHFRHAEDLNVDLRKKGVYDENERKAITAWLGLRNDVDHAHWEKYSLEKVDIMLKDVRRLINQYPA